MAFNLFKKSKTPFVFLLVLLAIGLFVYYDYAKHSKKLKIYAPADVNPKLVDFSIRKNKKNHTIANFKLINQNGEIVTNANYEGKIYVADFFFTRCKTICLAMAYNMSELQEYFKNDDDVMFLSHSVTPVMDSVPVLKEYAKQKGIIDGKWNVTTGDKKHIYELARKSYFAVLDEGDGGVQDFIHTENFILIDKERRIRGYYDGTQKEEMQRIISDIALLKQEYTKAD